MKKFWGWVLKAWTWLMSSRCGSCQKLTLRKKMENYSILADPYCSTCVARFRKEARQAEARWELQQEVAKERRRQEAKRIVAKELSYRRDE